MEQNEYRIYATIIKEIMFQAEIPAADSIEQGERFRNEWYDFAKKIANGVIEKLKENGEQKSS